MSRGQTPFIYFLDDCGFFNRPNYTPTGGRGWNEPAPIPDPEEPKPTQMRTLHKPLRGRVPLMPKEKKSTKVSPILKKLMGKSGLSPSQESHSSMFTERIPPGKYNPKKGF